MENITSQELKAALDTTSSSKSPEIDGIQNLPLKQSQSIHPKLTVTINNIINEKENIPR